ncbi:MAG: hypothetical protein ACJ8C4_14435 [Gemmataceae bacterium]
MKLTRRRNICVTLALVLAALIFTFLVFGLNEASILHSKTIRPGESLARVKAIYGEPAKSFPGRTSRHYVFEASNGYVTVMAEDDEIISIRCRYYDGWHERWIAKAHRVKAKLGF